MLGWILSGNLKRIPLAVVALSIKEGKHPKHCFLLFLFFLRCEAVVTLGVPDCPSTACTELIRRQPLTLVPPNTSHKLRQSEDISISEGTSERERERWWSCKTSQRDASGGQIAVSSRNDFVWFLAVSTRKLVLIFSSLQWLYVWNNLSVSRRSITPGESQLLAFSLISMTVSLACVKPPRSLTMVYSHFTVFFCL